MSAGAVLVFLPGTKDIEDAERALRAPPFAQLLRGAAEIMPLHGSLSTDEQNRVFRKPAGGLRKVVLATNVAESSVTIDDVVYVVNTGKLKEKRYDLATGVSSLQSQWASAANNKQRRGRAGRVRPGMCVNLFLPERARLLPPFQTPEMLRVPLDELCLTVKSLQLGRCADVLAEALQPPDPAAVGKAVDGLRSLGALDGAEALTPLGRSLAQLPLEPRVGKMLVLAGALGVLEPALTIAACAACRDPFFRPLARREAADAARLRLGGAGACSDHMVLANTFERWSEARDAGQGEERRWCEEHFVSFMAMNQIARTREQLRDVLRRCGLADGHSNFSSADRSAGGGARRVALLRAVLAGSLWPNIVLAAGTLKTFSRDGRAGQRLQLHSEDNMGLQVHPASTTAGLGMHDVGALTVGIYQVRAAPACALPC